MRDWLSLPNNHLIQDNWLLYICIWHALHHEKGKWRQISVIFSDAKLWCRFAQLIGKREHAEYMLRITKDENQHSHIEREEMHNEWNWQCLCEMHVWSLYAPCSFCIILGKACWTQQRMARQGWTSHAFHFTFGLVHFCWLMWILAVFCSSLSVRPACTRSACNTFPHTTSSSIVWQLFSLVFRDIGKEIVWICKLFMSAEVGRNLIESGLQISALD